MTKNVNVQHEVEYCQKNEKIEDLSPCVCTSVRECNPIFCLVFCSSTWDGWMIVLNTMFDFSCSCFWSQIQSDSVTLAGGTLSLLVFHKVRPVILSISPAMILESCALNAGLPIGFLAGIIHAGVAVPLPLLPLVGTLWCTDVGLTVGRFFGGFDK